MTALMMDAVPHVLDEDEIPFVIGFGPDARPSLEVDGVRYRRAGDRCLIDFDLSPLRLRALLMHLDDGNVYLMANAGPLFNEWWPMLARETDNPVRPFLSAGAARTPVMMQSEAGSVGVTLAQPSPVMDMTVAVIGIGAGLTTENLVVSTGLALAVIKAALLTVGEYRSLVNQVPDVNIQTGSATITLDEMLTYAGQAAEAIAWQRVG